jgi:hypothetical protein
MKAWPIALGMLMLVGCAPAPVQQVVVERVITATPAPVVVKKAPTARPPVVDDIDKFSRLAEGIGLEYDGKDGCATGIETDGVWYADYGDGYNICFAVVNGRAQSIGGYLLTEDSDAAAFGTTFSRLAIGMGWPAGLLTEMAGKMGDLAFGEYWYGDFMYAFNPAEDYSALFVAIIGPP